MLELVVIVESEVLSLGCNTRCLVCLLTLVPAGAVVLDLVKEALAEAKMTPDNIDALAYTKGTCP